MRRFLAIMVVGLLAAPAVAQGPWYARGEFNGWPSDTSNALTDLGGGHWSTTVTGLFDNTDFEYKISTLNWATNSPGANGKVTSNAAGEITFHMYDQTTWNDGWSPNNQRRVGYDDPLEYGWELVGGFNDWPAAGDPNYYLTSQGNGLYSGQFAFNAGIYDFKFRKQGDFSVNYSKDFGNNQPANTFSVGSNGDVWQFDLDLPNGRLRAIPTTQHGDFNGDGNTDAADYVWWRENMPTNTAKYTEWRSNFGRLATWVAHGSFGADVTLMDQSNGNYGATLSGLTAGQDYDVSVLRSDAGAQFPNSPVKIAANASGNINLHYYKLQTPTWTDGWSPSNVSRVGYDDPQQFGWEVIGPFNGTDWNAPATLQLTDQGNGLYTGSFAMTAAGAFEFKFRKQGDWGTSIGNNFGNSAGNNLFTVATIGDMWNFELDLPNGRWRAYHPTAGIGAEAVPEPASLTLVMLGMFAVAGVRRRKR